jgi:two-component system, OmpR family, manganese sensing response regulator
MARILLADDSETILLLLRTRLEMEGHEVETAADGQEVVDVVIGAAAFDLLLLDAMMPRKSGIDALRELRAAGIDTPALIVSAHTDGGDDNGDRADLSIDGYITKPIDFDQLFTKIAEVTRPGPAA